MTYVYNDVTLHTCTGERAQETSAAVSYVCMYLKHRKTQKNSNGQRASDEDVEDENGDDIDGEQLPEAQGKKRATKKAINLSTYHSI